MRRLPVPTVVLLLAMAAMAPAAHAGTLKFAVPAFLPHEQPNSDGELGGGEPGLAFDPSGNGHVYVTAPQGIGAAANGAAGAHTGATGVGYWASDDGGKTWPRSGTTGTSNGGGDTDQIALADHTVLFADLEAADTDICISHDFAATFDNCSNGISQDHAGPEDDREWFTPGLDPKEVYLTYHDFAAGFPIIEHSTDDGSTFTPCGEIIDPTSDAGTNYNPGNGTLVSKPVIDKAGNVYVGFMEPEAVANPVGATLTRLYMASGKAPCSPTTIFTDHSIYHDAGATFGNLFEGEAIDGGDELYALVGGRTKAGGPFGMYLFTSTDHAEHWNGPIRVSPPDQKATMFPTIAGGPHKGEAIIGWFGTTTSDDPNDTKDQWRFYAAATYDGGQTFNETTVTPDVAHSGDICNQGVLCGLVPGQPGNRNLADFASAAVDPADSCAAFAIPQDPYNNVAGAANPTDTFGSSTSFTKQQDPSTCFTAANSGLAASQVGAAAGGTTPGGTTGGGGGGTTCLDKVAPVSRFTRATLRGRRTGFTVSGRSSDRGCGTNGRGKVARMFVALGRATGKQCRYVRANGRFGPVVSCLRTTYLPATGTTSWRFALRHRLPAGKYVAWVRGIDAAGNVERKARTRNLVRFTIR